MSPDEYFLKAYKIKSVLSLHAQMVFKFVACLVLDINQNEVFACTLIAGLRNNFQNHRRVFGPYRSHFLSRKSLIAAKNETKEKRRKEEEETHN